MPICDHLEIPSGYCSLATHKSCFKGLICHGNGKCSHPFQFRNRNDTCAHYKEYTPEVKDCEKIHSVGRDGK
jgi:hypothetical protein